MFLGTGPQDHLLRSLWPPSIHQTKTLPGSGVAVTVKVPTPASIIPSQLPACTPFTIRHVTGAPDPGTVQGALKLTVPLAPAP